VTTVNFTQVLKDAKSASFEALPVGDYDVEVEKADSVTSSNGRPMIKTTFKVIVGPHTNRKIINNYVLVVDNPTALAIFFRNMKALGLTDEFWASLGASGTLDPAAQSLIGRRARLKLGQKEWNGEMRNEVSQTMPYTGAPGGMGGPAAGPVAGPSPMMGTPGPASTPGPIAQIPAQVAQQHAPVAAAVSPAPAPAPVVTTPAVNPVAVAEVASAVAEVAAAVTEVATAPQVESSPPPPALPI
jgi:hypothetical protein